VIVNNKMMGPKAVDEMNMEAGRGMSESRTVQPSEGVGDYRLGRRLDDGGANEVYEAERPGTAGKVVVKFLQRARAAGPQATEACRSDHALMGRLRHPNIASLLAMGTTSAGVPYVVREHFEGETLEAKLSSFGRMDPHDAVALVKDIATALAAAHAAGVLHGELRPSKVLLSEAPGYPGGFVKLVDIGLWRLTGDRRGPGAQADVIRLTAPELITGNTQVDGQADQFSLAAIAYRMLTGVDVFRGDDVTAVVRGLLEQSPALSELASFDATVGTVLRRALAKDPRERFPGILEFAASLDIAVTSAAAGAGTFEETTGMLRTKTARDIASSLVESAEPPNYAKLVEVVRPRGFPPGQEMDAAAMGMLSMEAGLEASGRQAETPRGRPRTMLSRRALAVAATLLSAVAGVAWWTGLAPLPELQPEPVWRAVMFLTQR
jgi:serine/threonine kinase PknH